MPPKLIIKWLLFFASIVGTICCSVAIIFLGFDLYGFGLQANSSSPANYLVPQKLIENTLDENSMALEDAVKERSAMPTRLTIPVINVDTVLERVGLTSKGAVDIPKNQNNAAWFELGSRPGENGVAIITGHYGWKDNKPSAFDNLYKLHIGDKLFIEDEKGATTTFVVRETQRYNPDADASGVFISEDGASHLNLITCEGVWNKDSRSYSKRLVVFADKE
jgi:LPXTG-site transpeptidase (sortase) family protein